MSTSRRGFLRGVAGVGAGAAATGLAGCAPNIAPAPVANAEKDTDGNVRLMVSRYPDLAREGGAITLRLPGEENLLVTHPEGTTYAVVSSTCTHSGCPLGFEEGKIICPCHLSSFDSQGKVTNPPAKAPLSAYAASFDSRCSVSPKGIRSCVPWRRKAMIASFFLTASSVSASAPGLYSPMRISSSTSA